MTSLLTEDQLLNARKNVVIQKSRRRQNLCEILHTNNEYKESRLFCFSDDQLIKSQIKTEFYANIEQQISTASTAAEKIIENIL